MVKLGRKRDSKKHFNARIKAEVDYFNIYISSVCTIFIYMQNQYKGIY